MSWQSYVDDQLIGTGFVKQAALHGLDGNPWATSSGFNVSKNEASALVSAMADPSPLYSSGILLAGKKYQFIRNEPGRSVYGKLGAGGCCVVKTNQCIIIAVYDDSVQPGQCTTVVEKLADYLIDVGY